MSILRGVPDIISLQILVRVPALYDNALRGVNRCWRSLIDSHEFHSTRRTAGFLDNFCLVTFTAAEEEREEEVQEASIPISSKDASKVDTQNPADKCTTIELQAELIADELKEEEWLMMALPDTVIGKQVKIGIQSCPEMAAHHRKGTEACRKKMAVTCLIFDTKFMSWFQLPLPESLSRSQIYSGVISYQNYLWLIGGEEGESGASSTCAWRYNLSERLWEKLPDMVVSKQRPLVAALGSHVYALGVSTRERFGFEGNAWEQVAGIDWPFLRGKLNPFVLLLDSSLYCHKRYLEIGVSLPGIAENWSKFDLLSDHESTAKNGPKVNLREDKWLKVLSEACGEVIQVGESLVSVRFENFYYALELFSTEKWLWVPLKSRGDLGLVIGALKTKAPQMAVIGNCIYFLGTSNSVAQARICSDMSGGGMQVEWRLLYSGDEKSKTSDCWAFIGIQ